MKLRRVLPQRLMNNASTCHRKNEKLLRARWPSLQSGSQFFESVQTETSYSIGNRVYPSRVTRVHTSSIHARVLARFCSSLVKFQPCPKRNFLLIVTPSGSLL